MFHETSSLLSNNPYSDCNRFQWVATFLSISSELLIPRSSKDSRYSIKSSSIHTPLISLRTPLLNTPLYYLFTPHSITKFSHPNPIDTLDFVPPNPQTHPPHFLPKQNPKIRRSSKFGLITQLFSWFFWFFCSRNLCSRIRKHESKRPDFIESGSI